PRARHPHLRARVRSHAVRGRRRGLGPRARALARGVSPGGVRRARARARRALAPRAREGPGAPAASGRAPRRARPRARAERGPLSGLSDTRWTLVVAAQTNDIKTIKTLCKKYRPAVVAYLERRGLKSDAKNMAQKTL